MAATRKKRRSRRGPKVTIPIAKAVADDVTAADAIAALDASTPHDDSTIPDDVADGAGSPVPSPDVSPDADSVQRDAPRAPASPATSSGSTPRKTAKPAKPVSLTGNKFGGLNRDKLLALAAYQENQLIELRARVEKQIAAPAATKVAIEKLETALAYTWGMIGEAAALKWGDEMLLDEEQETLGSVWAPVLADLLENDTAAAAKWLPLLIAATSTGGIFLGKARQVKKTRELAAAKVKAARE